jgi:hypothetical protein
VGDGDHGKAEVGVILWTQNSEVVARPITETERRAATEQAVEAQIQLRDHRLLRKRVNESLDREEAQIVGALERALVAVSSKSVAMHAVVGYDTEAGETVLASEATRRVLARRPMTDADRIIAGKMETK